ncbi:MAG TPA: hypothetical protein VMW83_04220 [Spirochaetia bacterium]|nr:hypothetical protein [Spirochaetia bacterium]
MRVFVYEGTILEKLESFFNGGLVLVLFEQASGRELGDRERGNEDKSGATLVLCLDLHLCRRTDLQTQAVHRLIGRLFSLVWATAVHLLLFLLDFLYHGMRLRLRFSNLDNRVEGSVAARRRRPWECCSAGSSKRASAG